MTFLGILVAILMGVSGAAGGFIVGDMQNKPPVVVEQKVIAFPQLPQIDPLVKKKIRRCKDNPNFTCPKEFEWKLTVETMEWFKLKGRYMDNYVTSWESWANNYMEVYKVELGRAEEFNKQQWEKIK